MFDISEHENAMFVLKTLTENWFKCLIQLRIVGYE